MSDELEYLSVQEAADELGVGRRRVWRLIEAGVLYAVENPLDRRSRLVQAEDVRKLSEFPRAPKIGAGATIGSLTEETEAVDASPPRRWPRSIGMASDGSVQSADLEDYLRAAWHPE
ncbi:MAG: helix-turn-helix domain-containing protein [Chloroflexota bacterium]